MVTRRPNKHQARLTVGKGSRRRFKGRGSTTPQLPPAPLVQEPEEEFFGADYPPPPPESSGEDF